MFLKMNRTETPKTSALRTRKPEWNSYLTDGRQYKMSPEEQMRKKEALVSPHNRLVHGKKAVKKRMKTSKRSARSVSREEEEEDAFRFVLKPWRIFEFDLFLFCVT